MGLSKERRSQTSVPRLGLSPTDHELIEALAEVTQGRCAFCEASDKIVAHRFRPAGNALPAAERKDSHLFYAWLADAWQNLFPICMGCQPPEPYFPVVGDRCRLPSPQQVERYVQAGDGMWTSFPPAEQMLLLDPAMERTFDRHLVPKLDGELTGASRKGSTTIEIFNLNRGDRRLARKRVYGDRLATLMELLDEVSASRDRRTEAAWAELFDFDRLEFGGTWHLMLRRIARRIGSSGGARPRTSRSQLMQFFGTLAADNENPAQTVRSALAAIERDDMSLRSVSIGRAAYSVRAQMREIRIRNYKSIEELALDLPEGVKDEETGRMRSPSLIVLGENATGKSSLLEAIALTLATDEARSALDPTWREIPLDPGQMGGEEARRPRSASVEIRFETGQSAALRIHEGAGEASHEFGTERVPVFAYGAFRRYSTGNPKFNAKKHIQNLFDGDLLANPEPWLRKLPSDRFDMVVRALRDLLSVDGEFDVIQRVGRARQLRMVTAVVEPNGTARQIRAPLQSVSSGYRSMLAMVCDILRGLLDENVYEGFESFETARGVVLIDEIEVHLHPRWKVQVMTSLRAALPGMTFIVTTHDPLCLRGMRDDEIIVLQRVSAADAGVESDIPTVVERMSNLPAASDLRLEQLLTSDFFQLFSTNDPAGEHRMWRIADLMRDSADGKELAPADRRVLSAFRRDIASALPVGTTEVHRIVQEAVARFLRKRREASSRSLENLSETAKREIVAALMSV